jgi:hypothetical protein
LGLSKILVELFIQNSKEAPRELILDFEANDDWVLRQQEGRAFHGYYGDWCFLPICVFCGEQLLVSYLRPSNADPARHAWAILNLLVTPLRQEWPQVKNHLPDNLPVLAGYTQAFGCVFLRKPASFPVVLEEFGEFLPGHDATTRYAHRRVKDAPLMHPQGN